MYASRPRRPYLIHIRIKLHEDIPNGYCVTANTRMFRKKNYKGQNLESKKGGRGQFFLYSTRRPDLVHIPIKLHEDIPNSY